eukprot:jgi/Mesvir1/11899/Mv00243-RA.1
MATERILEYAGLAAIIPSLPGGRRSFVRRMNRQVRWTGGGKAFLLNYPESRRQVLVVGGSGGHGFSGADPSADSEMVMEASLGVRFHRGYLASARSLCEHLLTHPSMVKRGGGWHMDITGGGNGGRGGGGGPLRRQGDGPGARLPAMRGRLYGVVARALGATAATLYGNASSSHKAGRESHDVVEDSRRTLARHLGVRPGDVIFTGGATESNNIIIHSVLERARGRGVVLTTKVEHPSVLQPLLHVRKASRGGVKVVQLPVDREGFVRMDSLREAVKKWGGRIKLVSVIYANNEIGTVQDMGAIRRAVGKGVHIHADTTQVAGKAPLGKDQRFMDSFTVSGHKIHGVKGVGALVVRAGADSVVPLMHGGGQERGVRPGTESPPLIASLAQAASINMSRAGRARWRRTAEYAARLREGLGGLGASFNGPADPGRRMANLVSFALPGTDGRAMVEWLSRCGICANVGSACSKMKRSRVLRAVGVPEETARGTVRLGLSAYTTQQDVDYLLSCLRRFQKT